jgi:hypothetical protein
MILDRGPVGGTVEVVLPFVGQEDRLEAFGVEVEEPGFGPCGPQFVEHEVADAGVEAVLRRVAIDDEGAHQKAAISDWTLVRKVVRCACVTRFMSWSAR